MRLKLEEAVRAAQSLPIILDREIPAREAFLFARLSAQLSQELKIFEETRFKLIEKYGERDDNGNLIQEDNHYKISDPEAFQKEYNELLNHEIEVTFDPIDISRLDGINFKPRDLINLSVLLKDGGDIDETSEVVPKEEA